MKKENKILRSINAFARKMASMIYFRALRDGFVSTVPFLVLAGVMILVNNIIIAPETGWIAGFVSADTLTTWQELGNKIINGTLNCYSLMIGALIANSLAKNHGEENPIFSSLIAIAVIMIFLPLNNSVIPIGSEKAVEVGGVAVLSNLGTSGIFVAIFAAILSTELFVRISQSNKFKLRLSGGGIPPAVVQSFEAMTAIMLTLLIFGLVSFGIHQLTHMEIHELINKIIQAPLIHLTTSLPGFVILCFFTNILFALGIHPSGIVNPILEPPLLVAMNQNTEAFAAHQEIPNIIVLPFRDLYGHIGGTGSTIALIIAIFIFSRKRVNKQFAGMSGPLGVFNINEPVIYGFPVVFNPLIMIPFVFGPLLSFVIAYFATWAGLVSKIVVYVPWSMPPLLNAWVASGGDFRNVILQLLLLSMMVVIYIPFLRAYENSMEVEVPVKEPMVQSENLEQVAEVTPISSSKEISDEFSDFTDFK
ncbi:Lichenan permease IIC component [Listeria monocytogenes]|uniref:PTS sugar transporter subunit IIC n=1 Tax=Listeria monocytogenes TaxID=1639 RepID=UPI000E71876E|nr:PTS transporter subunit EIIC [Listeria monocytogenes]RJZ11799.1 Lichenan permease IIC component [Listeria monocytogenes]